jgi:hypothetical protein
MHRRHTNLSVKESLKGDSQENSSICSEGGLGKKNSRERNPVKKLQRKKNLKERSSQKGNCGTQCAGKRIRLGRPDNSNQERKYMERRLREIEP